MTKNDLTHTMMNMVTDPATDARQKWQSAPDGPEKEAAFVYYMERLSILHEMAEGLFGTRVPSGRKS